MIPDDRIITHDLQYNSEVLILYSSTSVFLSLLLDFRQKYCAFNPQHLSAKQLKLLLTFQIKILHSNKHYDKHLQFK